MGQAEVPEKAIPNAAEEAVRSNIRVVAQRKKVSQAELCRRTGIKRTAMNRLMNGPQRLNVGTLWLLADALGVAPMSLFAGVDDAEFSEHEVALVDAVRAQDGAAVLEVLERLLPQDELAFITAASFSPAQRRQLLTLLADLSSGLSSGLRGLAQQPLSAEEPD